MPLDQSPPGQSVAGLGDAAAPDRGAARMLRRYEAEIGHQLAGTLAKRYGINQKTVAKWKKRTSVADLSVEEEAVIVAFRRYALLPLDDCLHALQPTISHLTRSSLHHCLQRHGIGRLPDLEGDRPAKKKFKSYPIGFFHIDIAEVRTEQGKLPMFAAIDRTSKFASVELHERATTAVSREFLLRLIAAVPVRSIRCAPTTASSSRPLVPEARPCR
jgi:hypothetical protein